MTIIIKQYTNDSYQALSNLYRLCGSFDAVTDSRTVLQRKIGRDPESVVLAWNGMQLVGSISIIEDGWFAWLRRLVAQTETSAEELEGMAPEWTY